MDLRETMKALCSECGPSGFEGPVAAKARQLIEPLCDETWIDKTGCVIRPGIDQLPGTCQAFWCLQNGILRRGRSSDLLIASPDQKLAVLLHRILPKKLFARFLTLYYGGRIR